MGTQAQNLKDAFNAFDPTHPLRGESFEAFYVRRPEGIEPLMANIRDDERETSKWLFTGHRGSGKSTELIRLSEALKDQYFTVYYTVEEALDMADVDYKDVLLSLGSKLYEGAGQQGVRLPRELLEELVGWFSTTLQEVEGLIGAEAALEAKADFFFLKLLSRLKSEARTREVVRRQIESNLSDLLERLNTIIAAIRKKRQGQQVLAVVDGLDKVMDLDTALKLYYRGGVNLLAPMCKVVYTVPLALYYTSEFGQVRVTFDGSYPLPNIKVQTREGDPHEPGREMMRQLIRRRMDPSLITAEAVERLVDLSGGVVRELVSLAKDACANARARLGERVEPSDAERAASAVRNNYRRMLTLGKYRELWRVHTDPHKQQTGSPVSQELIHNLSLLEYLNDESWWDVHPIVMPLLEERADEMGNSTPGSRQADR